MAANDSMSDEAPIARVRRLLQAARTVANDPMAVAPLVASTGLSREGVLLALARCLELDAPDADLLALLEKTTPAPRVHVILSANVFTAPLRALAVACAASSHVSVRPSRRDPFFTRALVGELQDAGGRDVTLTEAMDVASVVEGEIHVYGRDETIQSVRRDARPGVLVRAHGAGLGVALVGIDTEVEPAARALADDVVVFDQRGCLSPRIVFVAGPESRSEAFAEALHTRLGALDHEVPRGPLDADEAREARRYLETMAFSGSIYRGLSHAVGIASADMPLFIPPVGRHVHVVAIRSLEEARATLEPLARFVVTVGCGDPTEARALLADTRHVRLTLLGRMQRPPLDGPVDLR
jgi:Acyl-CoA reductase (LuxC)